MRKSTSSRWQCIVKALGFARRETSKGVQSLKRHSLRMEPLEERQLLSATVATVPIQHIIYSPATNPSAVVQPADNTGSAPFTPAQIRAAYGIDSINLGSIVGDGSGQTIAIVDYSDDPNIESDLHQFDSTFNLPDPIFTKVKVDQNGQPTDYVAPDVGWSTEIALDVEWAHAVAPGANILLVESDSDLFAAVDYARQVPGVVAVSMSWGVNWYGVQGIDEIPEETSYDSYFTTPADHTGVTFLASTGDSGEPASYPAISPNVVAVGGTTLTIGDNGAYVGESGWSGSGGSQSPFEIEPGYQYGVQDSGGRETPDVAFDADLGSGVYVYNSYNPASSTGWWQVGGTSLSAPCWAGLVAITDQLRASQGLGSLDSTQTLSKLYLLPSNDFHDVTTGNNGFPAGAGYDMVTGLGSPVANTLVPDLAGAWGPDPTPDLITHVTHTGNFTAGDIGDTYTITVGNIGDAASTGTVSLTDTLPAGLTATAFSGDGWDVNLGTLTATRSDPLASYASYPPLTLTVNVASDTPHDVTNSVTVSGGGEQYTSNDTALDPTTIAYVRTWDGGGADNNWSDPANWEGDVAPQAGDQLVFAGDVQPSTVNDLPAGTTFSEITFTDSGFTLSGNSVTLNPKGAIAIDDVGSQDTIALPITLGKSCTFEVTGAGALNFANTATIDTGSSMNWDYVNFLTFDCDADSVGSHWANSIIGTGSLDKTGQGTVTLTGQSSYLGYTYIEEGTLAVAGGDNRLPALTAIILKGGADNAVFQLGDATGPSNQNVGRLYNEYDGVGSGTSVVGGAAEVSTLTVETTEAAGQPIYWWPKWDEFAGTLGGSGTIQNNLALVVNSQGLMLDGENTYAGGTTIYGMAYVDGSDSAFGTGPIEIVPGVENAYAGIGGFGTVNNNIVTHGTDVFGPSGTLVLNGNISGDGSVGCLNCYGGTLSWYDGFSGTTGNGLLVLGGDNSGFTGTWGQAEDSNTGTMTTVFTSADAGSANAAWQINGGTWASDIAGASTLQFGSLSGTDGVFGNPFSNAGGTLNNALAGSRVTYEIGGNNQSTEFDGVIDSGSGNVNLTKTGTGTLTLTGANTFASAQHGADVNIENGTLALAGGDNRLPAWVAVTLGSGSDSGVLQLGDASGPVNQTVARIFTAGTGTANAIVGGASDVSNLTLVDAHADWWDKWDDFAGTLGGSGTIQNNLSLTVDAAGLMLDGENTYAGGTYVRNGVVAIDGSDSAFGTGQIVLAPAEGAEFSALEGFGTVNNDIVFSGTDYVAASGTLTLNGNISGSGTIYSFNYVPGCWGFGWPDEFPATTGDGVLQLGGDNSGFTGTFAQGEASDTGTMTTYFTAASAGSASAAWQLDGGTWASDVPGSSTIQLGSLAGTGGTVTNYLSNTGGMLSNALAGSTLTYSIGGNNQSTEFDGVMEDGAGIVALTKVGEGTLTLSGANTYSGVTTIESGTLQINNVTETTNVLTNAGGVNNTGGFLVLDYNGGSSPASNVESLLAAAYNGGVSSFHSGQIRNTNATSSLGLGWVNNATTGRLTIMPSLFGDVNLDGVVDDADCDAIVANYNQSGKNWSTGDVNYDSVVNAIDLVIASGNYGAHGPLDIVDAS
jgi:uncharacterized repeat protein (TIGR01451 family)